MSEPTQAELDNETFWKKSFSCNNNSITRYFEVVLKKNI